MSKNYIVKERLLALGAKFNVFDELGREVYFIEADKFDIGKNIYIYTSNKNEMVLYLEQKFRIGAHKYIVYDENKTKVALIDKKFMIPEYNVSGIYGNVIMKSQSILGMDYIITKNDITLGMIYKEWNLIGKDRYKVEVINEEFTVLLIGLSIIVDMVKFHRK